MLSSNFQKRDMVQKMLEQRRNDKFQSMAQVTSNSNSEKTVSPPN